MKDLYQSLCFDVFFIKASSRAKNIKRRKRRIRKKLMIEVILRPTRKVSMMPGCHFV